LARTLRCAQQQRWALRSREILRGKLALISSSRTMWVRTCSWRMTR